MPTRLSDIIIPKVYKDLAPVDSPEKIALTQSGLLEMSPLINELANAIGAMAELPFWKDIDPEVEPNLSTDDPDTKATPTKVT